MIDGFDFVGPLFQMEHQLLEWERKVPVHLSLRRARDIPSEEDADICERFRILLTLRYHNLRILIHRLVLVKFLDSAGSTTQDQNENVILQQIGSNSVQRCVESSMEIISIVTFLVHSEMGKKFLGAWWFSLYYSRLHLHPKERMTNNFSSLSCGPCHICYLPYLPRPQC